MSESTRLLYMLCGLASDEQLRDFVSRAKKQIETILKYKIEDIDFVVARKRDGTSLGYGYLYTKRKEVFDLLLQREARKEEVTVKEEETKKGETVVAKKNFNWADSDSDEEDFVDAAIKSGFVVKLPQKKDFLKKEAVTEVTKDVTKEVKVNTKLDCFYYQLTAEQMKQDEDNKKERGEIIIKPYIIKNEYDKDLLTICTSRAPSATTKSDIYKYFAEYSSDSKYPNITISGNHAVFIKFVNFDDAACALNMRKKVLLHNSLLIFDYAQKTH